MAGNPIRLDSIPNARLINDAMRFVDDLAAPIDALRSFGSAPHLPGYGDLEEIGRGGMGVVHRPVPYEEVQRTDAIKIIRPDRLATASPEMVRQLQFRFEQESRLTAQIAHEHIVPVYQVGEVEGSPWFSMQFVHGRSLRELSREESLSSERVVRYFERMAGAVDAVHRHGVLHGDIKPQNILIEVETDRPLITDFGLADFMTARNAASWPGVAGTPALAPELAKATTSNQSPDDVESVPSVASDVYSLGASLWATLGATLGESLGESLGDSLGDSLTGSPPDDCRVAPVQSFANVTSSGVGSVAVASRKIPPRLQQICLKAHSDRPADRYASARDFADALSAWLDRPRWNRHFPMLRQLLWMVVAPALLLSGVVVWWLLRIQGAEFWVWLTIFCGYVPLFASFYVSQQPHRSADPARREIWAVWLGHFAGTLACMISLRLLCDPSLPTAMILFYPCWAAISAVVFVAKSANFWGVYRWIGVGWFGIAILLAAIPSYSPLLFGVFAAATCLVMPGVTVIEWTSRDDRNRTLHVPSRTFFFQPHRSAVGGTGIAIGRFGRVAGKVLSSPSRRERDESNHDRSSVRSAAMPDGNGWLCFAGLFRLAHPPKVQSRDPDDGSGCGERRGIS